MRRALPRAVLTAPQFPRFFSAGRRAGLHLCTTPFQCRKCSPRAMSRYTALEHIAARKQIPDVHRMQQTCGRRPWSAGNAGRARCQARRAGRWRPTCTAPSRPGSSPSAGRRPVEDTDLSDELRYSVIMSGVSQPTNLACCIPWNTPRDISCSNHEWRCSMPKSCRGTSRQIMTGVQHVWYLAKLHHEHRGVGARRIQAGAVVLRDNADQSRTSIYVS